jgi:hypothetical protein
MRSVSAYWLGEWRDLYRRGEGREVLSVIVGGLINFKSRERRFEAGGLLVEAASCFGSTCEEGGKDEANESSAGGDPSECPLHPGVVDHEAPGEEGEREPEAEELGDEGTRAVNRRIFVEAHRRSNDGRYREKPGE